jgi:hypothetical protein
MPARRAGLGAGMPAIRYGDLAAVALGLVLQHGSELSPARTADGTGQMPVTDHAGHIQVLHGDHVEPAHQARTGLVQEVPAGVGHPGMRAGDLNGPPGPISGPALGPGQPALPTLEPPLVPLPVLGVRDLLANRQGDEMSQPHVYPDAPTCGRKKRRIGHVSVEGHEPASGRVPCHSHRRGIKADNVYAWPSPHEPQWLAHLRQPQRAAVHRERVAGIGGGLAAVPGLEPRIAGTPGEERLECSVLMPQCLLERHAGHLVQKRQFLIFLHLGQRRVRCSVGQALSFGVVEPVPVRQSPVPHDADASERAREHALLRLIGIGPAPVSRPHSYTKPHSNVERWEARRAGFLPHLNVGDFRAGVMTRTRHGLG